MTKDQTMRLAKAVQTIMSAVNEALAVAQETAVLTMASIAEHACTIAEANQKLF